MFIDKIEPIIYNVVATLCRKYIIPEGIGTVRWSCTNDEGKLHAKTFNNVLYLQESPVNILIPTALDESIKDNEGTWVQTKRKYSFYTWYYGKYKKTISH